jgi:CheY-like chemotaxis protein
VSQIRGPSRPPPVVLIVEDDVQTREMYAEWLAFSTFTVIEASRAAEAIEKAVRFHPDIITTDIGLRGEDGCQLCQQLKADDRTRTIPVITVTAWAMGGHVERAWRAGCDSVLVKPVLPDALVAEILRILNIAAPSAGAKN